MRRPWIVVALLVLAVMGAALIITADEEDGPALIELVTGQGLFTRVPEGWTSDEVPFEFGPPDSSQPFDQWTVARACPPDGCSARSMAEWLALAEDLPTFDNLASGDEDTIFDVVAEDLDDARVVRAQTEAGGRLVFVAAFTDGAEAYVACSVQISIGGDQDLADAVVDVCRATNSGGEPFDENQ